MSYPATLTPNRASIFGGVLIFAGLLLVVFAVSARNDSPLFMVGGLVLVGGVLRLTTALSGDARRRRLHPVDPNDPRWHDGSGIVQLAGRTCVECGKRIIIGAEGRMCDECSLPTHIECERNHRAQAHGHHAAVRPIR
jgi:hypothetical protein